MNTRIKEKVELGVGAPCGLFCGNCPTGQNGKGPYLSCTREHCPSRLESATCEINQCCVADRGLSDCSVCLEFPCNMLLQFSHSPQHPERVPAILNLQRRNALGVNRWLAEERMFWKQNEKTRQWDTLRQMLVEKRQYCAEIRTRILELTEEIELATLCTNVGPLPQQVRTQV
jgi:hypothetical protein